MQPVPQATPRLRGDVLHPTLPPARLAIDHKHNPLLSYRRESLTTPTRSPPFFHNTYQVLNKEADTLRIIHSDKERVFEDEATVGDQEVNNDDVVYVVYRKNDSNEFEAISSGAFKDGQ